MIKPKNYNKFKPNVIFLYPLDWGIATVFIGRITRRRFVRKTREFRYYYKTLYSDSEYLSLVKTGYFSSGTSVDINAKVISAEEAMVYLI